jgi:heme exporter protein C
MILVSLWAIFIYAPIEKTMGVVQKIFYYHVPSAWVAFLAFFIVFLASIWFLWHQDKKWDILASCSAELGVIFCSLVLITGPIWAKPAWNVWWTWDIRLTTTLILWLIYVAYLILRNYTSEGYQRGKFAAVFGIIGFVNVPLVFMSIRWWERKQHPSPVIMGKPGSGLEPSMLLTLIISLIAFTLLFSYLLVQRVRLETMKDEVERLREDILER